MKIQIIALLILCCLLFSSWSCKKEKVGIDGLPAITQTGENTFGCLVNGELLIPKYGKGFGGRTILETTYGPSASLRLSAVDRSSKELPSVTLYSYVPLKSGLIIPLVDGTDNFHASGEYFIDSNNFRTNNELKGELTISYFDEVKHIVSGRFWFDALNKNGDKVEIREGRFDIKYD